MMAEKMPMTVEMTVSEGICAWRNVARLCFVVVGVVVMVVVLKVL